MSYAFIIEVKSRAAGIVVRDGRCYRFHAAEHDFNALDGRGFSSPGEAQKVARRHAEELDAARAFRRGPNRPERPDGRPTVALLPTG